MESAPVNISCQRNPSVVMMNIFPVAAMGVTGFLFVLYSVNDVRRKEDSRITQVKRLFMCNGFAKIATKYDHVIKKELSFCYEE